MKKIGFVLAILLQGAGLGLGAMAAVSGEEGLEEGVGTTRLGAGETAPLVIPEQMAGQQVVVQENGVAIAQSLDSTESDTESTTASEEKPDLSDPEKFEKAIDGTEKLDGLFTLYRNPEKGDLYAAIPTQQLNKSFLLTMTLEGGIGEGFLYSGLPLQDFLFYFRKVDDKLQFVVRNVNFRAEPGDPVAKSLDRSFSDSVLYAFEIKATDPDQGGILIDLGSLLLEEDLADLGSSLQFSVGGAYGLDADTSYFDSVKAFPLNLEIQANYGVTRSGDGGRFLPTLADDRAFNLQVHYSLSQLPQGNGYRPRVADDRVGYFVTVYQNLSDRSATDPFTRYVNRWHLEKQDPTLALSPPKEPIVFWIENTVPLEYRSAIREGVLMWNEAFEKAGFRNAVEVRQMPDDADWDPADIRYNTIRWLSALDGAFAIGPSRVNPLTGQILDADILIGANFVRAIRRRAELFTSTAGASSFDPSQLQNMGGCYPNLVTQLDGLDADGAGDHGAGHQVDGTSVGNHSHGADPHHQHGACRWGGLNQNFAMGALSIDLNPNLNRANLNRTEMERFTHEFLRELTAHEVGHTLGLRHNFRGSTFLQPDELHNTEITRSRGLVSSVMDYNPVNLAPWGTPQGDYFTTKVGPYDEWAIEYGYRPSDALAVGAERQMLREIAQRSPEPELDYGTDEDSFASDPFTTRFDLSADPLQYARWQMDNAEQLWQRLDRRYPTAGGSYSELTDQFDQVFFHYFVNALTPLDYIGGQSLYRNHAGDPDSRIPLQPVPLAQQLEALALLETYVFQPQAFDVSPEFLNKLAPSRWSHWGNNVPIVRLDYPLYDRLFFLQRIALRSLLSNYRLELVQNQERRMATDQALTLPTLFETLERSIWTEVIEPKGDISSLRRALQREHMNILISMVLRQSRVPEDARTLAWYQLRQLQPALRRAAKRQKDDVDVYTLAHLEESYDRITKALDASLQSSP